MSTTKALKKLVKAVTGSAAPENVNTIAKCISLIADKFVKAPAVTSSDNGKVMKVVEGVWAASAETTELPAHTSADANKVLAVKSDGTLEWKTLG